MSDTRGHENQIRIAAPADAVWRAITEPEQVTKWFCEEAEVDPRPGGRFFVKWGEGVAAEYEILDWEPGRRLRLVATVDDQFPSPSRQLNDYLLEPEGDGTILRIVHSGIPQGSDWDGFYDATNAGWKNAFVALAFIAEHHLDHERAGCQVGGPSTATPEQGWKNVLALLGGDIPAAGERFAVTTALGDAWSGTVLRRKDPAHETDNCALILSIDELNRGLFTAGLEIMGPGTYVGGGVVGFQIADDVAADLRERYGAELSRALAVR